MTALAPPDDYALLCREVRRRCGIDLAQYKRAQMERRVRDFAARRGVASLTEYSRRLRDDAGELDAFLDRVTINVSQLWRHPEQWTLLAGGLLAELAAGRSTLRAWSAGCSYGAEAYTLAAVCRDSLSGVGVRIDATDIDARMIERARAGVFDAHDARSAPAGAISRHFETLDDGSLRARRHLHPGLAFTRGDLLVDRPPAGAYDLILCRNTVIYFTEAARDALHARLAGALRPGGVLVVGATERVAAPAACGLTAIRPFVYRRTA